MQRFVQHVDCFPEMVVMRVVEGSETSDSDRLRETRIRVSPCVCATQNCKAASSLGYIWSDTFLFAVRPRFHE